MLTHTFDPTQFRHVIGHFMSGVTVITTHEDGRDHGMTASAVSSLSLEPPMLTVCLHRKAPTQEAVVRATAFAVNILSEGQDWLATRFATPRPDKFAGVAVDHGRLGQPLLGGALATIECEVVESIVGGTHRVFLGAVRHAEVSDRAPLAYYRGRFGRLEIEADDEALARVRRAVLTRAIDLDERLDPERLGALLEVPPSSVEFALARLLSERLVTRGPDGYRQVPLDVRRSDEAFDTKLILDLGAARLAISRATDEQLEALVQLARDSAPRAIGVDSDTVEAMVAANEAFHETAIGLADNQALLESYRELRLPTILSQVLWRDPAQAAALTGEHVLIAESLRARDLARSQQLITRHQAHGRSAHRQAIQAAGGRI